MTSPFTRLTVTATVLLTACAPESAEPPSEPLVPQDRTELVDVAGTELFVRTVGSGPPAIVVHGGPVLDHGYLYDALLPLAAEHELIFFDQRLSGRSSAEVPAGSMTIDRLVEDIEAIRAREGMERVDLVGHSWGGFLAALYAARHPDRVRRLVLVSPMAPTSDLRFEEEMAERQRVTPETMAAMDEVRASEAFQQQTPEGIERMLKASFRTGFVDPELADELSFHIEPDYTARSERFGALFPELQAYDVLGEMASVTAATLVVYGAAEPGAEIGGTAWAEAIPGASLTTIPSAGHWSFIEQEHEFLDRVDVFLDVGR